MYIVFTAMSETRDRVQVEMHTSADKGEELAQGIVPEMGGHKERRAGTLCSA